MIHDLYNWVLSWAAHPHAQWALFILAVAESSFFPIPPDVLLIAMGIADPENALRFALITSVGSVLGGTAGYGIGHFGGRPVIKRFLSEKNRLAAESLYNRYDIWAIAIAGFTPIPYKVFTISAGVFAIRFGNFLFASALSRPARFFLIGGALKIWGKDIQGLIENYFNVASVIFVVLLVGGFLLIRWSGRRLASAQG